MPNSIWVWPAPRKGQSPYSKQSRLSLLPFNGNVMWQTGITDLSKFRNPHSHVCRGGVGLRRAWTNQQGKDPSCSISNEEEKTLKCCVFLELMNLCSVPRPVIWKRKTSNDYLTQYWEVQIHRTSCCSHAPGGRDLEPCSMVPNSEVLGPWFLCAMDSVKLPLRTTTLKNKSSKLLLLLWAEMEALKALCHCNIHSSCPIVQFNLKMIWSLHISLQ